MSRLCGLKYYWLWPNTLQSGRWKVKPIRFDLSVGSCARFGQGNGRSEGETEAKETCMTSVIQQTCKVGFETIFILLISWI